MMSCRSLAMLYAAATFSLVRPMGSKHASSVQTVGSCDYQKSWISEHKESDVQAILRHPERPNLQLLRNQSIPPQNSTKTCLSCTRNCWLFTAIHWPSHFDLGPTIFQDKCHHPVSSHPTPNLSICIVQDLSRELGDVNGRHHGEPQRGQVDVKGEWRSKISKYPKCYLMLMFTALLVEFNILIPAPTYYGAK